ncbi:hypothetical protein CRE_10633 [Caenorhabditis remanei]|uniref:RING-type domain-containing protein n=1 Tax=Caenorhabditis remanei TaxID=31234 RepID=E3NBM7_CAERE|nr:hypothetical protein CRE_10633 [Caenorhabditis remanei]
MMLPNYISCFTTPLQLLNVIVTTVFSTILTVLLILNWYPEHTGIVSCSMGICIGITVLAGIGVRCVSWLLDWKFKESGELGKCRRSLLIWTGGVSLIGSGNLVVVYLMDMTFLRYLFIQFTTCFSTLILSLAIIHEVPAATIPAMDNSISLFLTFSLNAIFLVLGFFLPSGFHPNNISFYHTLYHFYHFIFITGSILDFSLVLQDEFRLGTNPVKVEQVEMKDVVSVVEQEEEPISMREAMTVAVCKVCDTKLPNAKQICKIKRQCEHTVCVECSNKLDVKKSRAEWVCPYCKLISIINGDNSRRKKDAAKKKIQEAKESAKKF